MLKVSAEDIRLKIGVQMSSVQNISGYKYSHAELNESHDILVPCLLKMLSSIEDKLYGKKLFELGCGNGSVANILVGKGYDVVGIDASTEGISFARKHYPQLKLYQGSAYDDLRGTYGQFDILVSLEVVEHLYDPRQFAAAAYDLLKPGGFAILSTPYHGYWKNLALSISGKMDQHFTVLWDHGHIKFWSVKTLTQLLSEAGFADIDFARIGRIPPLAKSIVAVARKPVETSPTKDLAH